MASKQSFADRTVLAVVVLIGLIASSWGPILAERPLHTISSTVSPVYSDGIRSPSLPFAPSSQLDKLSGVEDPGSGIEQPVPITLRAADVVAQAGDVFTWTQDTRADWESGTFADIDSATVSGTLQLAQRYFSASETITPREELASDQRSPDIAIDAAGNAYAVWEDYRDGHPNIYFAYRPAGGTWGNNVKVNDDDGTASQATPTLAVDSTGNAYAVWSDSRDGDADIYFAFRPTGGTWGPNVRINDDASGANQTDPDIAIAANGDVYVVWSDTRNGNSDIYFARCLSGGTWGANIKVNADIGTSRQSYATIAVDTTGNAYVTWMDQRNGNYDIYFAFRSIGGEWGANVKVNDDAGSAYQGAPAIAVDGAGNAYAVWTDERNGNYDIYFSHRPVGSGWETNVKVNADVGTTQQQNPTIAVDGAGNAYVMWIHSTWSIYFAVRSSGGVWGTNTNVKNIIGFSPLSIAVDVDGNAYAIWLDGYGSSNDVYFGYRPAGGSWNTDVKVNDDSGIADQPGATIVVDGAGDAYALWTDDRNGSWNNRDIYFALRPSGGMWGTNVQVNDNTAAYQWEYNAIAVDGAGNAYAVWHDNRSGNYDIYFAYRPTGGAWGVNIKINDDLETAGQSSPAIAVDSTGNAYAVWTDGRNGNGDIYFSYRPAGGVWGTNVKVNDDLETASQGYPAIAVDDVGNVYAMWVDFRSGNADIYFAYRPVGGAWGINVQVNDDGGTTDQLSPALAVDTTGNAYAVWNDNRNGKTDIYFAYRPVGGAWGTNVQVNDNRGRVSAYSEPSIAVDDVGHAYVIWTDSRDRNTDIYFAIRPAGDAWGTNIKVNDDAGTVAQGDPSIAVDAAGNIYTLWRDAHYGAYSIAFAHSIPVPEYHRVGLYTSPVLDTGVTAAVWGAFTYSATLPAGATLTIDTRSQPAGGAWSAWQVANGAIASLPGQSFQYRITFTTPVTDATPVLDWAKVSYTSVGTPSAPRFTTPCGVTNQVMPTLKGSATAGSVIHLFVDGTEELTTTTNASGIFTAQPNLNAGSHIVTATAGNAQGAGPASAPLYLTVNPTLSYDPLNVRAGQWSKDGWLLSPPRDALGCANPEGWQVWPRRDEKFAVQVPVSYTTTAAVTVTVGTQTITLTESVGKVFAGVFQPPITAGTFIIVVNADGQTTIVGGGPVLIDPDGVVYEASGTISDTIPGVQVTCYYSDTYSGQWLVWDARNYDNQINPQITLDDGYYSFYTPPGAYRVVAEKDGYITYTSPDLVVVGAPVRHNIPLEIFNACPFPLTSVGINGPLGITSTLYIDTLYTFEAVITPTDATKPITYTWAPVPVTGQGTDSATYQWSMPDTYTVTLTAENCGGPVIVTQTLIIWEKDETLIYLPLVLRNR